jgi:hypothetical protein
MKEIASLHAQTDFSKIMIKLHVTHVLPIIAQSAVPRLEVSALNA